MYIFVSGFCIKAGNLALILEKEIYPIIRNTVPRTVSLMGSEDSQELVQDATASAAEMVGGTVSMVALRVASCTIFTSGNRLAG